MDNNPLIEMKDVALQFLSMGFSVFPLWKGSKDKPLVQWKKYISERPTVDDIKNWWTKYPTANVAIITGTISDIFVLDTEKDFDLSTIETRAVDVIAKTGSGGRHFYFRKPKDIEVGTKIEIWGSDPKSKADIKGNGGYVVAPPSFNEAKNSYYEWLTQYSEIPEAPQWVIDIVKESATKKDTTPLHELFKGTIEGSRNVSAASYIGHLTGKTEPEMWELVVWPAILQWNTKNNPPMDEKELRGVYESITQREYRRRQGQVDINDLKNYTGDDEIVSSVELHERIEARGENEYKYETGIAPLDYLCEGFVPGELIIMSGPEKSGKTSFLQYLTILLATKNLPVLWFTYEMTAREFLRKFKNLPVFYLPAMNKAYDLKWLERKILEAKAKHDVRFVMIDHLEFILDAAQEKNLAIQLGTVVRFLKSIAREQELVFFVVHHIKRLQSSEIPTVRDLRDSALIAAEADSTLMIWRVPMYKTKKGEHAVFGNDSFVKVCNHRRTGVVEKMFKVSYNKDDNSFSVISKDDFSQNSSQITIKPENNGGFAT